MSEGLPFGDGPFGVFTTPVSGDAGWSSPVARQAHNLKVAGSNPAPATKFDAEVISHSHPAACSGAFGVRTCGQAVCKVDSVSVPVTATASSPWRSRSPLPRVALYRHGSARRMCQLPEIMQPRSKIIELRANRQCPRANREPRRGGAPKFQRSHFPGCHEPFLWRAGARLPGSTTDLLASSGLFGR